MRVIVDPGLVFHLREDPLEITHHLPLVRIGNRLQVVGGLRSSLWDLRAFALGDQLHDAEILQRLEAMNLLHARLALEVA